MARMSATVFASRFDSFELRDSRPNTPGMRQTQFVIMAPWTTFMLGNTARTRSAWPTTCAVSNRVMINKSVKRGFFQLRKKQMRDERNHMKNSGITKQKKSDHIHATRSSSLVCDSRLLPAPINEYRLLSRSTSTCVNIVRLLQYCCDLPDLSWEVINRTVPFEMTPHARTMIKVIK